MLTVRFSLEKLRLCAWKIHCDLVIGNIDGSKLPDMSHFSAAAVTRSQAKQSENACRKLKVPDQIINEDKEALKQAQATDPNLDSIRGRVESGSITMSRGLNRGETKFVRKKGLLYRQFTKGNKVTLQLVIPGVFREKVLRLAHETLLTEHLGIKKTLDRVVSEFFGQEFVVMWLGFVNLATYVRKLFRKVVSLRYLWEKCH